MSGRTYLPSTKYQALDRFEQWMVRSNLHSIREGEPPSAVDRIESLKAQGYVRVSEALTECALENLRAALRAENISWGELLELQSLADYIEPGDVELAEAAGIDEQEFAKR